MPKVLTKDNLKLFDSIFVDTSYASLGTISYSFPRARLCSDIDPNRMSSDIALYKALSAIKGNTNFTVTKEVSHELSEGKFQLNRKLNYLRTAPDRCDEKYRLDLLKEVRDIYDSFIHSLYIFPTEASRDIYNSIFSKAVRRVDKIDVSPAKLRMLTRTDQKQQVQHTDQSLVTAALTYKLLNPDAEIGLLSRDSDMGKIRDDLIANIPELHSLEGKILCFGTILGTPDHRKTYVPI